jgi:hypothetical protein
MRPIPAKKQNSRVKAGRSHEDRRSMISQDQTKAKDVYAMSPYNQLQTLAHIVSRAWFGSGVALLLDLNKIRSSKANR